VSEGAGVKFSSQVPKGDAWNVGPAVEDAIDEFERTGHSPLIPCVAFLGIKEIKVEEDHVRTPVVRLVRIFALDDEASMRRGRTLIYDQWERLHAGQTIPLDLRNDVNKAFPLDGNAEEPADDLLSAAREAQDRQEAEEDEGLTDPLRLRRHLTRMHKWDVHDPRLEEMPDADIINAHRGEHEPGANPGMPEHDVEWWQWRRVDIEAAEATADGQAAK
jgi:hypothetical protein